MSEAATEFKPNLEKLRRLQAQASSVVIGGKVCTRPLFFIFFFFLFLINVYDKNINVNKTYLSNIF